MSKSTHAMQPEDLMAYLDGELSLEREIAASKHLERCRECQRLAADFQVLSGKLMTWEVTASNRPLIEDITYALETRNRTGTFGRRAWDLLLRRRWLLPVGLVSALVIGFLIWFPRVGPLERLQQYAQPQALPIDDTHAVRALPQISQQGVQNGLADREYRTELATKPMIARTATLKLTTTDFDMTRSRFDDILKRHQGYLANLTVTTPAASGRVLVATARVPSDQLDVALTELKRLGRVETESQSGEEVTREYVDLEARLANARNAEQRLIEILRQRTGKLADVLAVEQEISRVRGEIERMDAERKNLANRVEFATIRATLTEEYKADLHVGPDSVIMRLRNAAIEGFRTMAGGVVAVAVFLCTWTPSVLIWAGLLFFPLRALWRRWRRSSAV